MAVSEKLFPPRVNRYNSSSLVPQNAHCYSIGHGGTVCHGVIWAGLGLSTVLAQDRFFSDSLSFTLDKQDPQSHHDDVSDYWPLDSAPARAADLMNIQGE